LSSLLLLYARPPHIHRLRTRRGMPAHVSVRQYTSAYVSIRQHTSAFVSIRQNLSASVSIHTAGIFGGRLQGLQARRRHSGLRLRGRARAFFLLFRLILFALALRVLFSCCCCCCCAFARRFWPRILLQNVPRLFIRIRRTVDGDALRSSCVSVCTFVLLY
jgi:hypothetical protein